jgi:hypothetical protein
LARYLVRVDNAKKYNRHQVRNVAKEFLEITKECEVALKNFRISEYAIEFDLFSDNSKSKLAALHAISSGFGDILTERDLGKVQASQTKEVIVSEAVKLFNEQRYWECHEILESIWRIEPDPDEKGAQQGVILAVSSLVHAQKDEDAVCFGMIVRALAKLSMWRGEKYFSLNVSSLKRSLRDLLATRSIFFPTI